MEEQNKRATKGTEHTLASNQKIGGEYIGTCNFILEGKQYIENLYRFNL